MFPVPEVESKNNLTNRYPMSAIPNLASESVAPIVEVDKVIQFVTMVLLFILAIP